MSDVRAASGGIDMPSGRWGVVPEQNRHRRGHAFYPPFVDLAKIPALYATENQRADEKVMHLHYFTGGCDWYIAELDPTEGLAYGWARVNYPVGEWGYIHLVELEELYRPPRVTMVNGRAGLFAPIVVERDLLFRPAPAADCLPL